MCPVSKLVSNRVSNFRIYYYFLMLINVIMIKKHLRYPVYENRQGMPVIYFQLCKSFKEFYIDV